MYMRVEWLPVIGLFGLVATAAGWAWQIYRAGRRSEPIHKDSRALSPLLTSLRMWVRPPTRG